VINFRPGPALVKALAVGLAVLLVFPGDAWALKKRKRWKPQGKTIRNIRIDQRDIFDTKNRRENRRIYRFVNRLHFRTKEDVIRAELLFKEGDVYDVDLAKESVRALRKILQLRRVRIQPTAVDDKFVDLTVLVQETWSTEPRLSFSGVGGDVSGKIGIREENLFGYGKAFSYFYKKDKGIINRSLTYDDPNVLRTRLRLGTEYVSSEDGESKSLNLARPFYSSVTPWSAGASFFDEDMDTRVYDQGREIGRFNQETRDVKFTVGFSIFSTPYFIRRSGLNYRYLEESLSSTGPGAMTLRDKKYHIFGTLLYLERVRFITTDHIRRYDREEDYNLGPYLSISPGFSLRQWIPESENATFLDVKWVKGTERGPSHFDLWTAGGEGRFEDGAWRNTRPKVNYEHYNHFSPRQTFAFHLQGEHIINPNADAQIVLGGDNGLRGYQLNQLSGNKLLLTNIEHRLFLVEDLFNLLGLGTATFFDAGNVWERGKKIDLRNTRMNVGAGLRFHISRSSAGHVLRLDVAYALKEITGESRTVITFGSEQAF